MCGIAGYRMVDGKSIGWSDRLHLAVDSLHYRGPDDRGVWIGEDKLEGLGHRRLSILDLSSHGHQPMTSICGAWRMVFNGEIYNFREIRSTLSSLGHQFAGSGDSEVILAAFSEWGTGAVVDFVGMFAIALWHEPTRRLHLIRDRLGVKPLYYRWDGKALCFGSELKALREFEWKPEINREALDDYLRYGYICDPRTIYKQVFKLPPAHTLTLEENGQLDLRRYWSVSSVGAARQAPDENALADELEALMIDAFKYRMIADVPVGVFLSGGVDSTMVAAILQKHGGQQIKTYTIGFDQPEFDESPFAAEIAQYLGTEHHCRILKADDAKSLLPGWGDLFDEPFGDDSGLPTLMVSRVAAEQVKVVLSADGGDELFSGYTSYASTLRMWDRISSYPQALRTIAAGSINGAGIQSLNTRYSEWAGANSQRLDVRSIRKLAAIGANVGVKSLGEFFDNGMAHFSFAEIGALTGGGRPTRPLADEYAGIDGEKLCLWDLNQYLPGDILTKVDRATMAVSIEGREPLLDHRLAEFAFSLPFNMRQGALGPKHLLKKVLYRYVPQALVDRPKRGFAVPVRKWLSTDLRTLVDEQLEPGYIAKQGLFNPEMVKAYLRRMHAGDVSVLQRVWLLVAFQLWHRRWMPQT